MIQSQPSANDNLRVCQAPNPIGRVYLRCHIDQRRILICLGKRYARLDGIRSRGWGGDVKAILLIGLLGGARIFFGDGVSSSSGSAMG